MFSIKFEKFSFRKIIKEKKFREKKFKENRYVRLQHFVLLYILTLMVVNGLMKSPLKAHIKLFWAVKRTWTRTGREPNASFQYYYSIVSFSFLPLEAISISNAEIFTLIGFISGIAMSVFRCQDLDVNRTAHADAIFAGVPNRLLYQSSQVVMEAKMR